MPLSSNQVLIDDDEELYYNSKDDVSISLASSLFDLNTNTYTGCIGDPTCITSMQNTLCSGIDGFGEPNGSCIWIQTGNVDVNTTLDAIVSQGPGPCTPQEPCGWWVIRNVNDVNDTYNGKYENGGNYSESITLQANTNYWIFCRTSLF